MTSSEQYNPVFFLINSGDLKSPLLDDIKIKFTKPDTGMVKDLLIPNITFLTNDNIVFEFCLDTLPNEDLPFGIIYLGDYGEYIMEIYTKLTLDIDWTLVWTDLFFIKGDAINYITN